MNDQRALPFAPALLAVLLATALPGPAAGQVRPPPDLTLASIEELMNIEITTASRKAQRAVDVAAAVFVITQDDIRRSGMTTIPDLLRMAPGVDVAQINSNKWAVSIRGFNALYANKLLVLVDGRSVYTHIFSGVLWDSVDLMLDDVDRIEVIRGSGAALWGANAVNGVINIVTKSAAETQGGLLRVDGGAAAEQGSVRYGGKIGAAAYRLFAQWTGWDATLVAPDTSAGDRSDSVTTGFRVDGTRNGAFMLEGDFTTSRTHPLWLDFNPDAAARDPIARGQADAQSGRLLGRWTHTRAGGATQQVQSFVEIDTRHESLGTLRRHVFDVDTQYHTALGARHDVVAGARYRRLIEELAGNIGLSLTPRRDDSHLATAFLQDEIALGQRVALTVGSQVQYDSGTGAGVQPTARVMWKARPGQQVWAAVSRALRTPSLSDRGIRADLPPVPAAGGLPVAATFLGNPAARTETFVDAQAGYRFEIGRTASFDVTGFVGRYEHLITQEVVDSSVQFVPSPQIKVTTQIGNQLAATTRGLEVAGRWSPIPSWRVDGSYTAFGVSPELAATSRDSAAATTDANTPRTQWQLRSAFSPRPRATLGVAVFHVGPLEQLQVPAYTRADVTAEWRFTSRLSAMATGRNLFDAAHAELGGSGAVLQPTLIPRSASLRLRWTF